MTTAAAVWLVIFAVSAALFLFIAIVVAIRGFFDLRILLKQNEPDEKNDDAEAKVGS